MIPFHIIPWFIWLCVLPKYFQTFRETFVHIFIVLASFRTLFHQWWRQEEVKLLIGSCGTTITEFGTCDYADRSLIPDMKIYSLSEIHHPFQQSEQLNNCRLLPVRLPFPDFLPNLTFLLYSFLPCRSRQQGSVSLPFLSSVFLFSLRLNTIWQFYFIL